MSEIIIYGTSQTAELAKYYIDTDTNDKVIAFTVEKKHRCQNFFGGLPVVDFEELENSYSPVSYMLFAPLQPVKMNLFRQEVYEEGIKKGYKFYTYVSSGTRTFNAEIGDNCFILENNTIQPFVKIGDNCVLWSGNHIWHHNVIGNHVFFTSQVVLSGNCKIGNNSFFGVNSTIKDGLELPVGTLVGMSSSVVRSPDDNWSVLVGNPAEVKSKKSWRLL